MTGRKIPFCIQVKKTDISAAMLCYVSLQKSTCNAIIYLLLEEELYKNGALTEWFKKWQTTAKKVCLLVDEYPSDLLIVHLPVELLGYEKMILLNTKSVFMREVSSLLAIDMGEHVFAACRKNLTKWQANEVETKLEIPENNYLDYSFCLVQTKYYQEWMVEQTCAELLQQKRESILTGEESLNLLYGKHTLILDTKWNCPMKEVISDQRLHWFTEATRRRMHACENPVCYSYEEEPVSSLTELVQIQVSKRQKQDAYIIDQKIEIEKLKRDLDVSGNTICDLQKKLQTLQKQYDTCNMHLKEIQNSFSYKSGMCITYVPRKLGMRLHKQADEMVVENIEGIYDSSEKESSDAKDKIEQIRAEVTEKSSDRDISNIQQHSIKQSYPKQKQILDNYLKNIAEGKLLPEAGKDFLQPVEDELIIDAIGMGNLSFILWIFCQKYGRAPQIVPVAEGRDGLIRFDDYNIAMMSYLAVTLQFVEIKDRKLILEGNVSIPSIWKSESNFCAEVVKTTEKNTETEKTIFEITDLRDCEMNLHLGAHTYECRDIFKLVINLDAEETKIIFFNRIGGQLYPYGKINAMRFCPVADLLLGQYFAEDGYIAAIEGNKLVCRAAGKEEIEKKEQDFEEELLIRGTQEAQQAVDFRRIYFEERQKKKKPIWLFMNRVNRADDNAEVFFTYVQQFADIESYFIIDRETEDYKRLQKVGHVIALNSREHWKLTLLADYIITSQANGLVENPFRENSEYYRDLYHRPKMIFLQHGVTKDDQHTTFNRYNTNLTGFVTSTKAEWESIVTGKYNYPEENVWLTGMPRLDRLYHNERKVILIMPSWRKGLMSQQWDEATKSMIWKTETGFEESEFVQRYRSLLQNKELHVACRQYGYRIAFMPHALLEPYMESFLSEITECMFWDKTKSYRDAFAEGDLLVTDYSSVAFDFAYLKKPVLYYQFDKEHFFEQHTYQKGYYDYEKDGFGPVVTEEEELVNKIIAAMENRCLLMDEYRRRIENTFVYQETSACERLYQILLEKGNRTE